MPKPMLIPSTDPWDKSNLIRERYCVVSLDLRFGFCIARALVIKRVFCPFLVTVVVNPPHDIQQSQQPCGRCRCAFSSAWDLKHDLRMVCRNIANARPHTCVGRRIQVVYLISHFASFYFHGSLAPVLV